MDSNTRFLLRLAQNGIIFSLSTLTRARRLLGLRRCVAVTKPDSYMIPDSVLEDGQPRLPQRYQEAEEPGLRQVLQGQ